MKYAEQTLASEIDANGEYWRLFRRDYEGLRVSHGEYEEWPVLVPILGLRWATYEFNGKKSMPNPNSPGAIPEVIQHTVKELLCNSSKVC